MDRNLEVTVVDMPQICTQVQGSKFAGIIELIKNLAPGKCAQISPPLDDRDLNALRQVTRYHGIRVRTRTTPEATFAWLKEFASAPPSIQSRRKTVNKNGPVG